MLLKTNYNSKKILKFLRKKFSFKGKHKKKTLFKINKYFI